jgi:hypothetical protein
MAAVLLAAYAGANTAGVQGVNGFNYYGVTNSVLSSLQGVTPLTWALSSLTSNYLWLMNAPEYAS